jgi:hypothetical protein
MQIQELRSVFLGPADAIVHRGVYRSVEEASSNIMTNENEKEGF